MRFWYCDEATGDLCVVHAISEGLFAQAQYSHSKYFFNSKCKFSTTPPPPKKKKKTKKKKTKKKKKKKNKVYALEDSLGVVSSADNLCIQFGPRSGPTNFWKGGSYILNKSVNATPELFAIYIQNYANQECNGKCILMLKYWVMHNSKSFTDVITRRHMKAI